MWVRYTSLSGRIQENLFSTPSSTSEEVIELEFEELIEAIDVEMKRIGLP